MTTNRDAHDTRRHRLTTVLFDIDGTLVDSNDAHADAWVRAFAEHGVRVDQAHVRRCIGMGGDKLMRDVSGIEESSTLGEQISRRRRQIFMEDCLPSLRAFPGARDLVAAMKARGLTAVAASSAKRDELRKLLALAGADALLDGSTSSDDADESKPDPDIVHAALQRAGAAPEATVMIGDTPYDIDAARRAGVRTIAFRCGGWDNADLSGAIAIYDGPWELLERLDTSVFGNLEGAC